MVSNETTTTIGNPMFKNHSVQMRFVKDDNAATDETSSNTSLADSMYIMHETGKKLFGGVLVLMTAYVALDTARQVTVNAAPKR